MFEVNMSRLSAAALVTASLVTVPTAASAAPFCQAGTVGCLLPLAQPTVATPVPVAQAPVAAAPAVAAEEVGRRGFPLLAILGALAAAGAILALVLSSDDDDVPVSP